MKKVHYDVQCTCKECGNIHNSKPVCKCEACKHKNYYECKLRLCTCCAKEEVKLFNKILKYETRMMVGSMS